MLPVSTPSLVLRRLESQVDVFLPLWTANMDDAGYLESTTAKREDCILAFRWFLEPLVQAIGPETTDQGALPSFGSLMANGDSWADNIIQTARRHRARGITGEMFLGCFKTLVHAIQEMVDQGDEPRDQKTAARRLIRHWADALETLVVRDWTTLSIQEADRSLDQANRRLTLEKCKYENVVDTISDLVLTIDGRGRVLEANRTARKYFEQDPAGQTIQGLLNIKDQEIAPLWAGRAKEAPLELSVKDLVFQCVFASLNRVSLASDEYLVILKDVTAHVKQSELLEAIVAKRTSELLNKKRQLEEMNVTLRTVMKSLDKEREAFQDSVGHTIRSTLLPALDPVRKAQSFDIRNSYLDIVEDQLLKLARGSGKDSHEGLLKLTPMEMKVSRFIQTGAATKEIAEALNLSVTTIQTHRKNIRRKLGLQNRHVNLATFLNRSGAGHTRQHPLENG